MFNPIETPRNYFTRELLHDNLSSTVAFHFNVSHWRPYLVVSCSEEVFCRPSTASVILTYSVLACVCACNLMMIAWTHRVQVMRGSSTSLKAAPTDGCYIRGLYVEGARWDVAEFRLAESRPKELYTDMPVVWLQPAANRKPPTKGIYECPVYKTLTRAGTYSLRFIIFHHHVYRLRSAPDMCYIARSFYRFYLFFVCDLTKRFFRQRVLPETSCLHYLLPEKSDPGITVRINYAIQRHFNYLL